MGQGRFRRELGRLILVVAGSMEEEDPSSMEVTAEQHVSDTKVRRGPSEGEQGPEPKV